MHTITSPLIASLLHESLQQGRQHALTIVSNSMAPLFRRGDQAIIAPARLDDLRAGDIIVVDTGANLLTHRYWDTVSRDDQAYLLTRGDRPLLYDAPLPPAKMVGQVVARRRHNRLLLLTKGTGRWLNRQLAALASAELRLLRGRRRSFVFRLTRRVFLVVENALVAAVSLVARPANREV